MLYKLYSIIKSNKHTQEDIDRAQEFGKLYDKYGVHVVGAWVNEEDETEVYLITRYNDAAHYEETVGKLRADPKYVELTEAEQASRSSTEVRTLKLFMGSP